MTQRPWMKISPQSKRIYRDEIIKKWLSGVKEKRFLSILRKRDVSCI